MADLKKIKLPSGAVVDITDSRIPALSGNGGKVLTVNSSGDAMEWSNAASGNSEFVVNFVLRYEENEGALPSFYIVSCDKTIQQMIEAKNQGYNIAANATVQDFYEDEGLGIVMYFTHTEILTYMNIYGISFDGKVWGIFAQYRFSLTGAQSEDSDNWEVSIFYDINNVSGGGNVNGSQLFIEQNQINRIYLNNNIQEPDNDKFVYLNAATAVRVNGNTYNVDDAGTVDIGTISGGSGGTGATTPQELGIGYGTCTTAAATVAKVVNMSGYQQKNGGLIAVYFTYNVPANATLNVNGTGACRIRLNNNQITAGQINAGQTALFAFYINASGQKYYQLLAVNVDINALASSIATLQTTTGNHTTAISNAEGKISSLQTLQITANGDTSTLNNYAANLGTVTNFEITGYDVMTASTSPTVTFGVKHGYRILRYSNATAITLILNTTNNADNYVLICNENTRDLVVTLRPPQYNGAAVANYVVPSTTITIPAGKCMELSYIANANFGAVTVGNELIPTFA